MRVREFAAEYLLARPIVTVMNMRQRAVRIAIMATLTMGTRTVAWAECPSLRAREARQLATVAFIGTLEESTDHYWFRVSRVWKGRVSTRVRIYHLTPASPNDLWLRHEEVGVEYVVFASRAQDDPRAESRALPPGALVLRGCSGTQPAAGARDFIRELGRGRRPVKAG
jgi:hypothetical protein